jgi:hypothetical protein
MSNEEQAFPFIQLNYEDGDFYIPPTVPGCFIKTKDIFDEFLSNHQQENTGKKFPFCCDTHKFIYDDTKNGFDSFAQKNIYQDKWWYRIEAYKNLPIKIPSMILQTFYHIDHKYNEPDGLRDICDYIEYNVNSFGQPAIFGEYYTHFLKEILAKSEVSGEKKEMYVQILSFIEKEYFTPKEKTQAPNLNELYATYQKWIESFPFNILYFKNLKEYFKKQPPIYLSTQPVSNRYTGLAKARIHDSAGLVGILVTTTKTLLKTVNTSELVEQGVITDSRQHTLELANEELRVKTESLLGDFTNGEEKYLEILQKWLTYQKEYFLAIESIAIKTIPGMPESSEIFYDELVKYGFLNLSKVKDLTVSQVRNLVGLLVENDIPFQIAMFEFLDFLPHLLSNFCKSKYELNNCLAKILQCDVRTVKGNIAVLNPKSNDDRKRYTSYLQKEPVRKAYDSLK